MQNMFGLIRRKSCAFSQLVKGLVIVGGIIYIFSFGFSLYSIWNRGDYDMLFTNGMRTLILGGLFLPSIISLAIICFYEILHPKYSFNGKMIISFLLFELYLLIPCVLFIFRYCDWAEVLSIVAAIVGIITPLVTLSNEQKNDFYRNIKFVFWTVWSPKCKEIENAHFNNQQQAEKESIYTDMNVIKAFQEHFVPYSREPELIIKHLKSGSSAFRFPTTSLTMLDIGGYDGKFTAKLLNELNLNIYNIEVVEPINIGSDYKNNLLSKCSTINFQNIGLETYNGTSTFDFVLASHSLYSSIDNKKYANNSTLVSDLLAFLNSNGIMVIIFGNANGKAYLLKKRLKKLILNDETEDTNSCEFENELKHQTGIMYKKLSIDNYIEIGKILKNEQTLKEWVSYFARVPIVEDKHILEGIKDLFNIYSVQYKNLAEETKKEYKQSQENILLLSHKTDVFLIKKT